MAEPWQGEPKDLPLLAEFHATLRVKYTRMPHLALRIAQAVAVTGTVAGIGYYCLSIYSALKYLGSRPRDAKPTSFHPPVSILKPLKGTDPEMYQSFRSHCLQNYPEYEIIFGVSDPDDPAISLVNELIAEFPSRRIRLMVCSEILGTNVKVSNLAQMVGEARHQYLVVNDSDIRVEPEYLQRVMTPLADEHVGLVTALYRGVPASTFGSHLEAIGISTDFSAGVLSAEVVEGGVRFGLGSTLAFRKQQLDAVGGFKSLLDYLADDYELGARIAQRGLDVRLADCVVETFLPHYSFREFVAHQLRWARAVRDSRPWGYFGLILTFGLPWALAAVVLSGGSIWAWIFALATLCFREAMAWIVGRRVLRDLWGIHWLWLIPVRDVIFVLVWLASYAGHKIHWRGSDFYLRKGRLVRVPE